MDIQHYIPLCSAMVRLMDPLIEIVIHDLSSDTIAYIEGGLSTRKVGDPSLLGGAVFEDNLDKIVYSKKGVDGRALKSISVPISACFLICINCDTSIFHQMEAMASAFLQTSSKPQSLFQNDWQERLHTAIHTCLAHKGWSFPTLTNRQKKDVAHHLFEEGAFHEKRAPDYVASALSLGRATIFNYLKEWRTR